MSTQKPKPATSAAKPAAVKKPAAPAKKAAPVKKTAPAKKTPAKPAPAKKTAASKTPAKPAQKKAGGREAMLARVESVRLLQRSDGHFDCFGTAIQGYCDQGGCCFHAECLSVSQLLFEL